MPISAEHLARLRVAAWTGRLPQDLGRELLELLYELAPAVERLRARDVLLRRAAALVVGSPYSRAKRIEQEYRKLMGMPRLRLRSAGDTVVGLVAQALEVGPVFREPSARHLLRILEDD